MMWLAAGVVAAALTSPSLEAATEAPGDSPIELAAALTALGPRPTGSPAAREAERLLLEAMRAAGLDEVSVSPTGKNGGIRNLSGVRRGASGREIVLGAHYDTVVGSPGAGDDASGCAVVLAAAARLAETPLRHGLRVVLFDAEETGLDGSTGWVEALSDADRGAILAAVQVEMVGRPGAAGAIVHSLPVVGEAGRRLAPGWLVHGALVSGRAVGFPLSMSDARLSLPAQLVVRSARLAVSSDANALLAAGIPSIFVSDFSWTSRDSAYHLPEDVAARLDGVRLDRWTTGVVSLVRRLDGLVARPRDEDHYIAAFGRVWLRRDLYWLGFLVWISLVWKGRPGRWRGVPAEERQERGREYLPGFFYRASFLLALLLAPVFATGLVLPTGVAALVLPDRRNRRLAVGAIALVPLALYVGLALWMAGQGFLTGLAPPTLGAAAVVAALVAFAVLVARGASYTT